MAYSALALSTMRQAHIFVDSRAQSWEMPSFSTLVKCSFQGQAGEGGCVPDEL